MLDEKVLTEARIYHRNLCPHRKMFFQDHESNIIQAQRGSDTIQNFRKLCTRQYFIVTSKSAIK